MMVIGPFIAFLVFILSIVILIGFSAICKRGQDYQLTEKSNGKDQQENQNSKLVKWRNYPISIPGKKKMKIRDKPAQQSTAK